MRSFVYGLYILALSLSPSLAQVPCTETVTNPRNVVTEQTPGFEPVVFLVKVPVDGDVEAAAKKAAVTFSVMARDDRMRSDDRYALTRIKQCTFTPLPHVRTDKMYLTARTEVVWELNTSDTYTLRTGFYLPRSLTAKRPKVLTELDDGTVLTGTWETVTVTVPAPHAQNVAPQKGARSKAKGQRLQVSAKALPETVQRTITQLTLEAE